MPRWILGENGSTICSECKEEILFKVVGPAFNRSFCAYQSDYCPHCGKSMRRMCEKCEYFSTCDRDKPFCGETE